MDSGNKIRSAISAVAAFRAEAALDPPLGAAVGAIKRLQARRFRAYYADLLASSEFGSVSRFFLEELYGDADYAERDCQFARIAGTIAAVFPAAVVSTAEDLAELHRLTEELDHQMAQQLRLTLVGSSGEIEDTLYVSAWNQVGRREDRMRQLSSVLSLGHQLAHLTRKPGVALMLRLMRRPAARAGLGSLQQFLERGFDNFASLSKSKENVAFFLSTIESRETEWIRSMFAHPIGNIHLNSN